MKIHRFYTGDEVELKQRVWVHNKALLAQWSKVLRLKLGDQIVLFDGLAHDRLYKLTKLDRQEAGFELVTEYERKIPTRNIYLAWSLLKKDKNDWVLQKATELGVNHFVPLVAERSEKTGFNSERARKIVVEASEQCGRSNIPAVREPLTLQAALNELSAKTTLLVCEQKDGQKLDLPDGDITLLVGPEGGWSDTEKTLFSEQSLGHLPLSSFTLRAETAAIAAVTACMLNS